MTTDEELVLGGYFMEICFVFLSPSPPINPATHPPTHKHEKGAAMDDQLQNFTADFIFFGMNLNYFLSQLIIYTFFSLSLQPAVI